ncbi:MAG: isoprenylcysteine carboxylmethyltransferase family protein [Steroidobacteraceae bacterium]
MNRSASTPRLRATQLLFLVLLLASAFVGTVDLSPAVDLLLRLTALLLVAAACLGRIWCSAFIAGQKDVALVQTGPYSILRHPLYALSFIAACGLALATRSAVLALVAIVAVSLLLASAARAEERMLAQRFASDWPAYSAATPRWWPRFGHYHLPQRVTLPPSVFWKAFLDAGAMLLLFVLIDAAATLRIAGLTPKLLALP